MAVLSCALALLSGVIGAGFASGREIDRFFAGHGMASGAAILCALATLYLLFLRLPNQLGRAGVSSLPALCRVHLGAKLGQACAALFFLLSAITGGAMLAACAELSALVLPIDHAYGLGMAFSLLLGAVLALCGLRGLAAVGAALCVLLPMLLLRLAALPGGEADFLPAGPPDLPLRAGVDGMLYGALNAAALAGVLPSLLALNKTQRRRASLLFCLLFAILLALGVYVCRRHRQSIALQALPFVCLSRALGAQGYLLVAACLYAAALSTLCSMLLALMRMLPMKSTLGIMLSALCCLLFARMGFGHIVKSAYPVLGALCAALLALLCLPIHTAAVQSDSMSDK